MLIRVVTTSMLVLTNHENTNVLSVSSGQHWLQESLSQHAVWLTQDQWGFTANPGLLQKCGAGCARIMGSWQNLPQNTTKLNLALINWRSNDWHGLEYTAKEFPDRSVCTLQISWWWDCSGVNNSSLIFRHLCSMPKCMSHAWLTNGVSARDRVCDTGMMNLSGYFCFLRFWWGL